VSERAMRRAERRKQKRQERVSARRRSFPWFTLLVVGVVLVFGYLGARQLGIFEVTPPVPTIDPRTIQPYQGQQVATMEAKHILPTESFNAYNTNPPNSGPHWSAQGIGPINWTVYTTQQRNEGVVHNLEHGGVLLAYDPSVGQDVVEKLKAVRAGWPKDKYGEVKIIIEPYAGMDAKIALTAWGWIDKMDTFDQARIQGFILAHIGKGPEDAP
jgi:Protein of unknown function (DUF3105)